MSDRIISWNLSDKMPDGISKYMANKMLAEWSGSLGDHKGLKLLWPCYRWHMCRWFAYSKRSCYVTWPKGSLLRFATRPLLASFTHSARWRGRGLRMLASGPHGCSYQRFWHPNLSFWWSPSPLSHQGALESPAGTFSCLGEKPYACNVESLRLLPRKPILGQHVSLI